MWSLTYEEDLLKKNFEIVFNESIFFKAASNVHLDEFKTDVVYWGGMDPWESAENSLYEISIAGEVLLKVAALLTLVFY